jgi:putative ABC transport system substrate-binding protein
MRRREFVTLLGSAAVAWPLAARARQPAMPVIGVLYGVSAAEWAEQMAGFRRGLGETGFVDGRNVAIEYRWAEGQYDRLPAMAADLVGRKVAVILAGGGDLATRAAMAATKTIPIVFTTAADPVGAGFVASLNRPGGNATGASLLSRELEPKRLELLHEVVPTARRIALLVNPANSLVSQDVIQRVQAAARRLALEILVVEGPPRARSRRPSRPQSNSRPPPSMSAPMRSLSTSATRLPPWLCAMRSPRSRDRVRRSQLVN